MRYQFKCRALACQHEWVREYQRKAARFGGFLPTYRLEADTDILVTLQCDQVSGCPTCGTRSISWKICEGAAA